MLRPTPRGRSHARSFRCQMDGPCVSSLPLYPNGILFFLPSSCQRSPPRYSVAFVVFVERSRRHAPLVGLVRVELTTSRLSGVRSNHLSYRPRPNVTVYRDCDVEHRAAAEPRIRRRGRAADSAPRQRCATAYTGVPVRRVLRTEKGGEFERERAFRASFSASPCGAACHSARSRV